MIFLDTPSFPSADGRRREADGVRVGAGDALVELVAVHLGHEPRVHGRDEDVEAVGVEQRYGLPAVRVPERSKSFNCGKTIGAGNRYTQVPQ